MSTEKKLTAVEWLEKQLTHVLDTDYAKNIITQAKEKEKQQIIDAYWDGCSNYDNEKEAEQYYQETYKN